MTEPAPARDSKPTASPVSVGAPERRALVIYGSRYGNTVRLAEALTRGLKTEPTISVDCVDLEDVKLETLRSSDLIAMGGPTEAFSASPPVKKFLSTLGPTDLEGKKVFAFDTRYEIPLSGSAARYIEHQLTKRGAVVLHRHESGFVRAMTKGEKKATQGVEEGQATREQPLASTVKPGKEPRVDRPNLLATGAEGEFEKIGSELAAALTHPAH